MQGARDYNYETSPKKYAKEQKKQADVSSDYKNMKVLRKRMVLSRAHKSAMFKSVFLSAILLVVMVGCTAYCVQIKYAINATNSAIAEVQSEIDTLNLAIDQQMSPAIIETKAKEELGMTRPSADQYVYLEGSNEMMMANKD